MTSRRRAELIRDEAIAWVNRLSDAHSGADRDAFQLWLSQSPDHRKAFDHASETRDAAGIFRASRIGQNRDLEAAFRKRSPSLGRAAAFASIAGLAIVGGLALRSHVPMFEPVTLESVMLSSGAQARTVTLADGSKLSMAPTSLVKIEIGRSERVAEVRQGRIQFAVKDDDRPFRIIAGMQKVEVRKGLVEASMISGQGSIAPAKSASADSGASAHFEQRAGNAAPNGLANSAIEFSAEPLGNAIERINQRNDGPRIELGPGLSGLRVTAVFQKGNSETIARALAETFSLRLSVLPSGALLLLPSK